MIRSGIVCLVLAAVAGCGSVTTHSDAGPGGDAPAGNGALTLAKPSSWVPQTQSRTVDFAIARDASTTGALTIHVANLPAGVTAADVSVASGASSGTLAFAADASSTLGSSSNVDVQLLDGAKMLDTKPFTVKVSGLPGTVDTTFGNGGKTQVPLPDPAVSATTGNGYTRAVLTYPASAGANADKILIAAQIGTTGATTTTAKAAVMRLNADGSPDTTFGGGAGYVLIDGSPANIFSPVGIALDSAGRIVFAAIREDTLCVVYVARLTASGAPDSSFTTFNAQPDGGGYCGNTAAITVLPGDKILVASTWNNPDQSQRPLLLQLKADGTPDTTAFGTSASVRLPNPDTDKPSWLLTHDVIVDSSGYILIGVKCEGGWNAALSACESVVGRVTVAGAWDASWGTAGAGHKGYSELTFGTTTNASLRQGFEHVTRDAAGNLVVAGYDEGYTTGVLARFQDASGAVDNGFGTSGRVTPTLVSGASTQYLVSAAIDSTGNLVAVGYANSGGPLIVTTRYTSAGVLDPTWGTAGITTTTEAGIEPQAALQSDDRLIAVGGITRGTSGYDVAAWRYWF